MTNDIVNRVTIVQVGRDECVDDFLQIVDREKGFNYGGGPKLRKAGFHCRVDLFVKLKS